MPLLSSTHAAPAQGERHPAGQGVDLYDDPLPDGAVARMGTLRLRQMYLNTVAFSPDGRTFATAGTDGTARLWEADTGRLVWRAADIPEGAPLGGLAFTPDGRVLACVVRDDPGPPGVGVHVYEVKTGRRLRRIDPGNRDVYGVAWSPGGRVLAGRCSDRTVRLWDAGSGRPVGTLGGHEGVVTAVAFSADGKLCASAAGIATRQLRRYSVRLWDAKTWAPQAAPQARLEGHTGPVRAAAFCPRGRLLATGGEDRTIRLWDTRTGRPAGALEGHGKAVTALAFSPDGSRLVSAGESRYEERTLRLWDVAGRRQVHDFGGFRAGVVGLAFSPDGKTLVTGIKAEPAGHRSILVWDMETARQVLQFPGHTGKVSIVGFSPDGDVVYSLARGDPTLRSWDAATGEPLGGRDGYDLAGLPALSADGKRLALPVRGKELTLPVRGPAGWRGPEGEVRVEELATGEVVARLRLGPPGAKGWNGDVVLSGRGDRVAASTSDATVSGHPALRLWDVGSDRERWALRGGAGGVAVSADGRFVAAAYLGWDREAGGGEDGLGRAALLDGDTGKTVRALPVGGLSVGFSPDGLTLASVNDSGRLFLAEVATGKVIPPRAGGVSYSYPSRLAVAYSPDGRLVATGGRRVLRLWDAATGEELARGEGHEGFVTCAAFSADGRRLVTGASDTTLVVWDVRRLRATGRPPPLREEQPEGGAAGRRR